MSSPVARRYARALYMLGVEENRLDEITRELTALGEVVRSSKELSALLANPVVSQVTRKAVMKDILARLNVSPTTRNAALLLTDRRRGDLLPDVAEALRVLSDERSGRVRAEVTSAVPLSEVQASRIKAALEKLTGRQISLAQKVDASLIGGVVTRIGDKVYDGSVRTRLDEIRQAALLPS